MNCATHTPLSQAQSVRGGGNSVRWWIDSIICKSMNAKLLLFVCLGLLLTACASSNYKGNPQELETRILADGSKQFLYRVQLARAVVGPSLDGRNDHRQQRPVPSRHD